VATLFVGFLLTGQAFAQDPTAQEGVHVQQGRDRYRIEQQIQQATAPLPSVRVTSPQLPPPDIEGKSQQKIFKLNRVLFDPVPVSISLRELESIADKYIAMGQVSMYDLYCMVVEIDGLFDKKHVLGRAGLPVQDVEDGIVTVQILEGRESQRTIAIKSMPCFGFGDSPSSSCRLFDRYFVQHQFRFSGRRSFNIQELEDEILRYNRTFRNQLVAEIEPGEDLGHCTLKLTRILPQPVTGGYSVDNSGRETSGRIRSTVYMNLSDVLGLNDSFLVSYDKTEGTTALCMQGEIPVSRFGTFADMSYSYGVPKTISGPFAILKINGTSEQYRPGLRQILVNGKERRLDATVAYQNYHSETFFDTALNYVEMHDALTAGWEYSHRKKKNATFAGMSVVTGHVKTMAPIPEGYVDWDFCLMKMNLMKVWYPSTKWTLILRGNGNAALSKLPQSQVFQIGGMATVRGTPESMISGESGYITVAEARYLVWGGCGSKPCCLAQRDGCNPKPCCPAQQKSVASYVKEDWRKYSKAEVFAFIDHGGVFYLNPESHSPADFLSTIGTGGTVQLGKHCSLSGGYGHPIFTEWSHLEAYRALLRKGNAFFTARVSF
jgi:hemolysin activation/secretion protein